MVLTFEWLRSEFFFDQGNLSFRLLRILDENSGGLFANNDLLLSSPCTWSGSLLRHDTHGRTIVCDNILRSLLIDDYSIVDANLLCVGVKPLAKSHGMRVGGKKERHLVGLEDV